MAPADCEVYRQAEATARGQQLGLWRDSDPTPPWEWRKAAREAQAAREAGEEKEE